MLQQQNRHFFVPELKDASSSDYDYPPALVWHYYQQLLILFQCFFVIFHSVAAKVHAFERSYITYNIIPFPEE